MSCLDSFLVTAPPSLTQMLEMSRYGLPSSIRSESCRSGSNPSPTQTRSVSAIQRSGSIVGCAPPQITGTLKRFLIARVTRQASGNCDDCTPRPISDGPSRSSSARRTSISSWVVSVWQSYISMKSFFSVLAALCRIRLKPMNETGMPRAFR